MAKRPKTLQEQIDLLKSRNMAFKDESNFYLNNFISPGHHIKEEFLILFEEFKQVPLYKMGFPKEWENNPVWK